MPRDEVPALLCQKLFARWPLPEPARAGDKEHRGTVLVVAGSPSMPGGAILAATAALRAGAGKLQIATCRSIAPLIATEIPEACVFALPQTPEGAIARSAVSALVEHARQAKAVLLGPGLVGQRAVAGWLRLFLRRLGDIDGVLVLDALAMTSLDAGSKALHSFQGRAIVTPHAGEMAALTGLAKSDVLRAPLVTAQRTSAAMQCVVALKGAITYVTSPDGRAFRNEAGNVGLGTSGSGDTLSGVIAGLAARGADALQAAAWGVHLHACAGDELARKTGGPMGFLARELLAEVPSVMARLCRNRATSK